MYAIDYLRSHRIRDAATHFILFSFTWSLVQTSELQVGWSIDICSWFLKLLNTYSLLSSLILPCTIILIALG